MSPCSSTRSARSSTARAAPARRAATDQGRDHELSRRTDGGTRTRSTIRSDPELRHAQDSVQPRAVHRAATTSWKRRRRNISVCKPGGEVRLKYAYIIKCDEVVKDAAGNVIELRCTADLESKTGGANFGPQGQRHDSLGERRARASTPRCGFTIGSSPCRSRMPTAISRRVLNPHSLEVVTAKVRTVARATRPRTSATNSSVSPTSRSIPGCPPGQLVFNRTITLKDTWAKEAGKR